MRRGTIHWRILFALASLALLAQAHGASALERALADRPDEITGPQVHILYVLPKDSPDQTLDTNGTIARSVAAFQTWLAGQTLGRRLRLDTYQGEPDITFVRLRRTDAEMKTHGKFIRDQIEYELLASGFTANKLYAIYYGGGHDSSCGDGAWPPKLVGNVASLYLHGTPPGFVPCDSNPLAPSVAQPGYFEFIILHEILHTLGIVPECAPNHTLAGHTSDDPHDLMYQGPLPWQPSVLDVGHNDYFGHGRSDCLDFAQSAFLEPAAPNAKLPPRWPMIPLSSRSCALESTMASREAVTHVALRIINPTPHPLQLYWLNYQGVRQPWETIPAWGTANPLPFVTHPWLLADEAGHCLSIFTTEPGDVTIDDSQFVAVVPSASVSLTLNAGAFRPGERLDLRVDAHNLTAESSQLIVGLVTPAGAIVFFSGPNTVGGAATSLSSLGAAATLSPETVVSFPHFLDFTLPAVNAIPSGDYTLFAALVRVNALVDNLVDPGDLLAVDFRAFAVQP